MDGTVTEGISTVNEAALTGEEHAGGEVLRAAPPSAPRPSTRTARDLPGQCVGQDTTLSQVIRLVRDAAATKAPLAKTADRVSGIFVPTVICIAAATFVIWLLLGQTLGLRWPAASACWSSAAPALSVWPRPSPSWLAAAWPPRTAS